MPVPPETAAIGVDIDALHRLAATLAGIGELLDGGGLSGVSISDPHIAAAVADVQRDWSAARGRIRAFLADAGSAVEAAGAGYRRCEQAIRGCPR